LLDINQNIEKLCLNFINEYNYAFKLLKVIYVNAHIVFK
jgi:hypothetical protein